MTSRRSRSTRRTARPSAPLTIGDVGGRRVAFLPRHGRKHELPPHRIPYRANVWAMRELGVRAIVGPCAAGSLQAHVHPGELVVVDQLVDRTWGRPDTFFDGPEVHHVSFADPYDAAMRAALVEAARRLELRVHDGGTMVVVQGPRFSTRAESRWFTSMGWEVVNMTGHPEAVLAAELAIPLRGGRADHRLRRRARRRGRCRAGHPRDGVRVLRGKHRSACGRSFSKRSPPCRNLAAPSPRSQLI